jgi:hypothetical protein
LRASRAHVHHEAGERHVVIVKWSRAGREPCVLRTRYPSLRGCNARRSPEQPRVPRGDVKPVIPVSGGRGSNGHRRRRRLGRIRRTSRCDGNIRR